MNTLALDIASLSTDMAMSRTMTDVSLSVLKKQMNNEEDMGLELVRMMEKSVTPNLGGNVDVRI